MSRRWPAVVLFAVSLVLCWASAALAVAAFGGVLATASASATVLSEQQLATIANRAGSIGTAESIEAVDTTAIEARVAQNPETDTNVGYDKSAPVTLVVVHGSFTDTEAHQPREDPPPSGTYVDYIV